MARPVAADAEATKARILQSALRLVADNGIEGTSIRDVAAGAGVSLATVLHYYGSKDGLHQACIDAMYSELGQLRAALFGSVTPGASLDGRARSVAETGGFAEGSATRTPRATGEIERLLEDAVRASVKFVRQHRTAHRILMRTMIDEGGMRADRREQWLRPFLDDTGALLAPLLGVPLQRVRMTAQSLVHLAVRYSLHSPAELRIITGQESDAAVAAAVEQHIIDVAKAMLLAPANREPTA